jgi:hypothetical protein
MVLADVAPAATSPTGSHRRHLLLDPRPPRHQHSSGTIAARFQDLYFVLTTTKGHRVLVLTDLAPSRTTEIAYPLHGAVLTNGDLMVHGGDHGECSDVGRKSRRVAKKRAERTEVCRGA